MIRNNLILKFFVLIINIKKFTVELYNIEIPKPYGFINESIESGLDILNILNELNTLLPQFSSFINQFNEVVSQAGVNVITDSVGNMSIDVPNEMSNSEAHKISTRINIIDRLIETRKQEINELLTKGFEIEKDLKNKDTNYTSQLLEKIKEFNRLKAVYKH